MKRIIKSRRGFALVEMVLTIAIICILAAVLIMSVSTYISNAKARSIEADSSRRSVLGNISTSESVMNNLGFSASGPNLHVHSGGASTPASSAPAAS